MALEMIHSCGVWPPSVDFAFCVQPLIVVVRRLRSSDPIARENQRSIHRTAGRKAQRDELFKELVIPMLDGGVFRLRGFLKAIPRSEASPGDNVEGLEETVLAGGFEAEGFVALFDDVRGSGKALGAVAAALHLWSGQRFDVRQKALLVSGANRRWRIGGGQRQRQNRKDHQGGCPGPAQTTLFFGRGRVHNYAISPRENRRSLRQSCQLISVPLVPGFFYVPWGAWLTTPWSRKV